MSISIVFLIFNDNFLVELCLVLELSFSKTFFDLTICILQPTTSFFDPNNSYGANSLPGGARNDVSANMNSLGNNSTPTTAAGPAGEFLSRVSVLTRLKWDFMARFDQHRR